MVKFVWSHITPFSSLVISNWVSVEPVEGFCHRIYTWPALCFILKVVVWRMKSQSNNPLDHQQSMDQPCMDKTLANYIDCWLSSHIHTRTSVCTLIVIILAAVTFRMDYLSMFPWVPSLRLSNPHQRWSLLLSSDDEDSICPVSEPWKLCH